MARILIADDDPRMLMVCRILLESKNHTIVAACENGRVAIEALQRLQAGGDLPDVVLTDFQMPQRNGLDVCHYALAAPVTKVILMTNIRDLEIPEGVIYLEKPFGADRLVALLASS